MTEGLERLARGEATLSRAAEIDDVSVWEMIDRAANHDVVWVDDEFTKLDEL